MSALIRYWLFDRYLPSNLKVRDPSTRKNYGHAFDDFVEFLQREPELSDLQDETMAAFTNYLLITKGLSATTVNGYTAKIKAFWDWAARKRLVDCFCTVPRVPVPEKIPRAWREDELVKLFNSCRRQRGEICGVPAWRWWFTIHGWWWCTSERIGATMQLRVEHLRLDDRLAVVPALIRKGKRQPRVYPLWADLVEMLRMILPPHTEPRELVWPWPKARTSFYDDYNKLLRMAGLPTDRAAKPHAMRVSHATWLKLSGGDPTASLGHKDSATTIKSYLDSTLGEKIEPPLFRPW